MTGAIRHSKASRGGCPAAAAPLRTLASGAVRVSLAVCAFAVIAGLALPTVAVAETSQDVRDQISQEQSRLDELARDMQDNRGQIDSLQGQIDDLAQQSIDVQSEIIEDRSRLNELISASYKGGLTPSLLSLVMSSSSIEDMVSRIHYAQKVNEYQADAIKRLNDDKATLSDQMAQISAAKDEQQSTLDELSSQSAEVQSTISSLEAKASQLEEDERTAALAAAEQARAAAEAAATNSNGPAASSQGVTNDEEASAAKAGEIKDLSTTSSASADEAAQSSSGGSGSTSSGSGSGSQASKPSGAQSSSTPSGSSSASSSSSESGWITCVASAYSIADNDPPGSTSTASGIPLDDSKPSVALPMSQNPSAHYGDLIEIRYNGMSVIATVTDCGYMGNGSRGLDLSTAVYRAFGFSSPNSWGLRTVSYRYL